MLPNFALLTKAERLLLRHVVRSVDYAVSGSRSAMKINQIKLANIRARERETVNRRLCSIVKKGVLECEGARYQKRDRRRREPNIYHLPGIPRTSHQVVTSSRHIMTSQGSLSENQEHVLVNQARPAANGRTGERSPLKSTAPKTDTTTSQEADPKRELHEDSSSNFLTEFSSSWTTYLEDALSERQLDRLCQLHLRDAARELGLLRLHGFGDRDYAAEIRELHSDPAGRGPRV